MRKLAPLSLLLLAACDRPQVERVELGEASYRADAIASPDTAEAVWVVGADQRRLNFGTPDQPPLLTLVCKQAGSADAMLTVIRHAPATPGAQALFAVIGNGVVSRFDVDAVLNEDEWRWEGSYPATGARWQAFTGPRALKATLPGGGMLEIAGSPLPREFVDWCSGKARPEPAPTEPPAAGEAPSAVP